jgi:hypothetical protein
MAILSATSRGASTPARVSTSVRTWKTVVDKAAIPVSLIVEVSNGLDAVVREVMPELMGDARSSEIP